MKKRKFQINNYISGSFLSLLLITFGALFIRTIFLDTHPNGFARDEAYLGYNAYSILKTGKDINGNFLPIFIESFLYTPAGYAYFSIPFIKFLGLGIYSVRFASALFGALTVPIIFLLVKELFLTVSTNLLSKRAVTISSYLASILLVINPWHINLSRTASVSTLVLFFIILGTYFLFKWVNYSKNKFLFFGYLSFSISLSFYIASFSFVPFLLLLFFVIYNRKIKIGKQYFFALLLIILLPIVFTYANKDFSLRIQSLSLTKNPIVPIILTENAIRDGVVNLGPFASRIFHNKLTVLGELYVNNYFKHLNYDFLFSDKAFPDRYRVPETGLIYPVLLFFLISGLVIIFKTNNRLGWFIVSWILLSPFGSSFANDDVPNMQRTLFMLPPLIVSISVGISYFLTNYKTLFARILLLLTAIVFMYQVAFYFHQCYIHENSYRPWYRQEGYEELVRSVKSLEDRYKRVVVTNRESAPTLFLSFFMEYDPTKLQSAIKKSTLRDTDRISFDKYTITQEECPVKFKFDTLSKQNVLVGEKGILYVNSGFCKEEDYPKEVNLIKKIFRTDGSEAFHIVEIR